MRKDEVEGKPQTMEKQYSRFLHLLQLLRLVSSREMRAWPCSGASGARGC